jgi:hypothetical protein
MTLHQVLTISQAGRRRTLTRLIFAAAAQTFGKSHALGVSLATRIEVRVT